MSDYDEAFSEPRTPTETPHSLAERYVIGALLQDSRVLRSVQEEVMPRDFGDARLADIYAGIIRMNAEGAPIDVLTVWEKLPSWDVRGVDLGELGRWSDSVSTPTSASYYAGIVREAGLVRSLADIGTQLLHPQEPGIALAKARADLLALQDRDMVGTGGVRWLRDVFDVPVEEDEYEWIIPGVLERKDRLMLSAGEGVGKSTLLRQISILSAGGIHPFRFTPMDPINVLVIDAENSERQWRREARRIVEEVTLRGQRNPLDHIALHCIPPMDIVNAKDLGKIHRWIDESQPNLIVLGPLYRMTNASLNDEEDTKQVINALDSIRERDVAMLIEVHAGHARGSNGERELRPRGSSALLGWPEFGLGLRRDKETGPGARPNFSLVKWRGDRDKRAWPSNLVHGHVWPWEPTVQV